MHLSMDMKKAMALCALCVVLGCDASTQSQGNSPGLEIGLAGCQAKEAASEIRAVGPKEAKVEFLAPDSIAFTFTTVLNCGARYAFSAAVIAPDTLALESRDIGDSRSKCVCEKSVSARYKARPGEDLAGIKSLRFDSQVYPLVVD